MSEEELLEHRQRDAEVCAKMVRVGWSMIEAVKQYAASQQSPIECRIGISNGQVRPVACARPCAGACQLGQAWASGRCERARQTRVPLRLACLLLCLPPPLPLVAPPVAPTASCASSLLATSLSS